MTGSSSPFASRSFSPQVRSASSFSSSSRIGEIVTRREGRCTASAQPPLYVRRLSDTRAVPGREVRLSLHDGETIAIAGHDVSRVCDNLWRLATEPDAVALVAVLTAESRHPSIHIPLKLTAPQSALLRKA